jgi:ferredoxin
MSPFTIDRETCAGHGLCYGLAPDSFDADDMGYAFVRDDAPAVPAADPGTVAGACPEAAIQLTTTTEETS